jgi:hypothetical protein
LFCRPGCPCRYVNSFCTFLKTAPVSAAFPCVRNRRCSCHRRRCPPAPPRSRAHPPPPPPQRRRRARPSTRPCCRRPPPPAAPRPVLIPCPPFPNDLQCLSPPSLDVARSSSDAPLIREPKKRSPQPLRFQGCGPDHMDVRLTDRPADAGAAGPYSTAAAGASAASGTVSRGWVASALHSPLARARTLLAYARWRSTSLSKKCLYLFNLSPSFAGSLSLTLSGSGSRSLALT